MLSPLESILSSMNTTFGGRLEMALERSRKERHELADAIGVSVQAIGQAISGRTKAMTAENTAKAARFLCVDWYWLATGEGQPWPDNDQNTAAWPFERVPLERILQLTPNQRLGIEDALLRQVDAFLGPDAGKSQKIKKSAA